MAVSGGGADDWVCVIEPWVMVVAGLMAVGGGGCCPQVFIYQGKKRIETTSFIALGV